MTIDLGFAWTEIDGQSTRFVDVPGHERFIKNMLAGVGGLDVGLPAEQVEELTLPPEFTVAEFRYEMEISRRQAVPLLEWLDGNS